MEPTGESARPMRVLVVDRHPNLRAALRADLEDTGFDVCGEAASLEEAVDLALLARPEICLLDTAIAGGAAGAVALLLTALPTLRIVLLAVERVDEDLVGALRAGAVAYLPKDVRSESLQGALAAVAAGAPVLPETLAARVHLPG